MEELARQALLPREPGSGTRSTAEELLDELGVSPATITVGSNGAIRESVAVGLGNHADLTRRVGRELEDGTLEEWRCATLPRPRAWHLVARAADELPATAGLFVEHLTDHRADGLSLVP